MCTDIAIAYCEGIIIFVLTETSGNTYVITHTQLVNLAVIQRPFGLHQAQLTLLAGWKCALQMDTGGVCVVLEQLILLQMLLVDS